MEFKVKGINQSDDRHNSMVKVTVWKKYSSYNFGIPNNVIIRYIKQKLLKIQEGLNLKHEHTQYSEILNITTSKFDRSSKTQINDIEIWIWQPTSLI